ncbi:MAG TPA: primosomal protein N' [Candidatus Akkermansia intestinavium]|nr:primosomal protein N' [Candidatus Akkermansia intestinavium]
MRAVRVLVDGRDDMVLDYALPPGTDSIERGCRVEIPLRGGKAVGTVLQTVEPEDAQSYRLRPILRTVDDQPIVSPVLLDLAEWAANYYAVPIEQMIRCIVPEAVRQERHEEKTRKILELLSFPDDEQLNKINARAPRQASILRYLHDSPDKRAPLSDLGGSPALTPARSLAKQGLLRICEETVHRDPAAGENFAPTSPLELNEEQAAALAKINEAFDAGDTRPILLQGVTGSGKTEVYLQAAARTMAAGKGVLILVPEISLTPQTMARFKSRFADTPGAVAILHSAMSDGERFDEWHAIRRGKARIAIGPRSAVFAPVQQLGLIIVDEEHDASYKQENSPRYQGRDLAVVRAKMEGATIVLGSATPSLESLHNAQIGKYSMLRLDHRADGQRLPLTRVLDMRTEPKDKRYQGILSERLRMAIDERLQRGEQTILLLNRRGFARALQCPDCGHIVTCEHCSLPMTYHLTENRLICHICGYRAAVPHECPACHSRGILLEGCGTQKVEAILRRCYPQARLQRVDADVAARKNALRDILADFRAHRIDILLGTQMISKGLDFPGVTLVGVLNADIGLSIPDPRAGERSFQLLTQVAGRAGRGDLDGEVIIQTFTPQAAAIQFARRHDTDGFAESELALRRQFGYPPFSHMAVLTVRSATEDLARLGIETLHRRLSDALPANVNLSPPIPSPIAKSYGQYRFQCTLSAPSARPIATHCSREIAAMNFGEDIIATLDIDAYTFS